MKQMTATLHFTELLLALIKGNTSLVDSLHILAGEGMEKPVKDASGALLLLMKKGRRFSESLRLIQGKKISYNQMYISLISAAELTGNIDNVLERIAGDLRRRQQATENALNIMTYPSIIIFVAITGTVFLTAKGLPFFISSGFLSGEILTNAINGIILAGLVLLLGGALLFIIYYRIFYLDSPEYRIFYVLDLLLKSNVPLLDAMAQCITDMNGTKYGISLISIKKEITGGISFSQAFSKFPQLSPYVTGWLAVADMHGNISEVCSYIKDFYAHKNSRRREVLTRLMEPAVIVLTGSYLLIILLTVVMPILTYAGGVL